MVELVWDSRLSGTITTRRGGRSLSVGGDAPFGAEDLLCAAVATSVMQAFLDAAAQHGLSVLAYLSTADLLRTRAGGVHLQVYLSSTDATTDEDLARVAAMALEASSVARLLGRRLLAEWHLRVLHGACPGDQS